MSDTVLDSIAERVCGFQNKENTVLPLLQSELADLEKLLETL